MIIILIIIVLEVQFIFFSWKMKNFSPPWKAVADYDRHLF